MIVLRQLEIGTSSAGFVQEDVTHIRLDSIRRYLKRLNKAFPAQDTYLVIAIEENDGLSPSDCGCIVQPSLGDLFIGVVSV